MRSSLIAVCVLCSALSTESSAQIRFEAPSLTQLAGGAPTVDLRAGLSVGDLNQDGVPDVVAPSQAGTLALLGRGDGTLSFPVAVCANGPFTVIADFDGDGHADIGWVHGIAYGDGSGQNWQLVEFSSAFHGGVVAADFDGDGRMDLAGFEWPDTILTFISRPNRAYQRVVGVTGMPEAQSTRAMRVCDLNRDGRPDIALVPENPNGSYDFYVLLGRGDGSFDCRAQLATSPETQSLAIVDFTGDGIPDIVAPNRHEVSLFPGLGDGTFAPRQIAAFDTLDERDIAVGDVTGDGIPDLVTSDPSRSRLLARTGFGNGTFGPRIVSNLELPLLGLELADMNRDGRLDVVSLCEGRGGVTVSLGDGAGHFGALARLSTTDPPTGTAIGDLNDDGRMDLVAITEEWAAPHLEAFLNQGGRSYAGPIVTSLLEDPGNSPREVRLADLDLDSKLDAVIEIGASIQMAFGNGDGTFRPPASMSLAGNLEFIADVNGDLVPDLVGRASSGIRVWPGLGGGAFGTAIDSPLPESPSQLAAGDLNGDGVIDLGIVTRTGVTHALGAGNGTFVLGSGIWPTASYGDVTVGDITGDGRDDLVAMKVEDAHCGSLVCGRVASQIQNPDGTMGGWMEAPYPAASLPRIADVSGDGVGDLLLGNELGFGVAFRDPGGHFSIEPGYGATNTYDIHTGDLDGDGHLDVVVASEDGVVIYYGRNPPPLNVGTQNRRIPDGTPLARIVDAFPNPAHSSLRVRFRATGPGPIVLSLFDAAGRRARTLYRGVYGSGDGDRDLVAWVADLRLVPGLYFLHLASPTGTDTRRIAVIR